MFEKSFSWELDMIDPGSVGPAKKIISLSNVIQYDQPASIAE